MTRQQDQVSATLHRALQTVLSRGLHDPRIRGLISVTRVEVAPDRTQATVYVSVLPAEHEALSVHGLNHAAPHIRTEVGEQVRIRKMPRLFFKVDQGLKKQAAVHAAIDQARRDDETQNADGTERET